MYHKHKPNVQGGAWIAFEEIDWQWSMTATPPWNQPATEQPKPTGAFEPSGAAAFPGWVNTSANFVNAQWVLTI